MSKDVKDFLEELKEYSNGGIPGLYPPEDTVREFLDYIEKLKETIKGTTHCFDEEEHQRMNNILTEFEDWLKSQIKRCEKETNPKQFTEHDIEITTNTMCRFQQCLYKLQELKEGRK